VAVEAEALGAQMPIHRFSILRGRPGRPGRGAVALMVVALLSSACSSPDEGVLTGPSEASVEDVSTTSTSTSTSAAAAETPPTEPPAVSEPTTTLLTESADEPVDVEPEPVDDGLELVSFVATDLGERVRPFVTSAMGGVRFSIDETHYLFVLGDNIFVSPRGFSPDTNMVPGAYLGLISQTPNGTRLRSIEDFLAQFDPFEEFSVEPNGTAVELFGHRLAGFTVVQSATIDRLTMFANGRHPGPPMSVFSIGTAEVFIAETPSGLLFVGYETEDEATGVTEVDETATRDALATLLSTVELNGPGFDPALPSPSNLAGQGAPPDPASVAEVGPPALVAAFSPIEAGTYQLPNFGLQLSLDIPDGWLVQPNFPGIVGLSLQGSRGPGDRGIVFASRIRGALAPVAGGPVQVGEPISLTDIRDFVAAPPAGLVIENVQELSLAGQPVLRFDVSIAQDVSCAQDDPCEFAFTTSWGFTKLLQSTNLHRVWWFDEHPSGRSMIIASGALPEFLDQATALAESAKQVG